MFYFINWKKDTWLEENIKYYQWLSPRSGIKGAIFPLNFFMMRMYYFYNCYYMLIPSYTPVSV